ncbi:MAG: AAA family ATPase [Elusimicrobia bacterium]|nr:AAA family ATPase [Elusimicrobiota bacterium]MBI4218458.1 AAA family ATPase [Elusimicrobiota bacterium]
MNNKTIVWITVVSILLIVFTIIGLASLESFYRNITLAQIPLQIFLTALNALVFVYFYMNVFRGGFGSMKKGRVHVEDVNVHFRDIIGLEDAKKEAWEVVQLLKDRARVGRIGGKIIKGVLAIGPPGCGKTLLAKGIACESGIPFMSVAGSEFVEIFVGVGASRVRKLFTKARQLAYAHGACIVFIDELDVIGRGRTFSFMGAGEETNSTQNQLLVEMDGLGEKQENVVVIGATNAGEEILDKALLRPGRFDRKIYIGRPNLKEREKLFEYYLAKIKYDPNDVNIPRLARKCVYKSPADIENIVKESALIAARKDRDRAVFEDFSEAIDRIDLGIAHRLTMTDRERELIAYHESGHLVILYFLHPTDDVFKASIISRGGALGMVHHQPREEYYTADREKIMADIKVALAGYVSEKIKYGVTSSGVASDFEKATRMAHDMVWRYGMGTDGTIGDFTCLPKHEVSEEIKNMLNRQSQEILKTCLIEVEKTLRQEWPVLEKFAGELLKKEELEYDEIDQIFQDAGKSRLFFRTGGANP